MLSPWVMECMVIFPIMLGWKSIEAVDRYLVRAETSFKRAAVGTLNLNYFFLLIYHASNNVPWTLF